MSLRKLVKAALDEVEGEVYGGGLCWGLGGADLLLAERGCRKVGNKLNFFLSFLGGIGIPLLLIQLF